MRWPPAANEIYWLTLRSWRCTPRMQWSPETFCQRCGRTETNLSASTALDSRGKREFASSSSSVSARVARTTTHALGQITAVVRDQVILGCADHDIKLDCLIKKGPSTPLEEVEAFVEGKESGKISLQQLSEGSEAAAPISSFQKQQRAVFKQHAPPPPLPTPLCTHCGQIGHGSSRDKRSDNCPAYGQTCTKCGKSQRPAHTMCNAARAGHHRGKPLQFSSNHYAAWRTRRLSTMTMQPRGLRTRTLHLQRYSRHVGEETLGPTTYTVVVHHSLPMRHSRSRPPHAIEAPD